MDLKIGLVGVGQGGPSSFHARSFSSIFNGFDPKRVPEDWPTHEHRVEGARVVAVWDNDAAAARELADVFGIDRVADTMEDVARDVDGVIVVDDITMTHQKKARFFLEEGVPTFIDKPLSDDAREAEELIGIAEKTGALMMSTSALRYARETEAARSVIDGLGKIPLATTTCQGQYMGEDAVIHYGIHPLELAYSVLGPGVVSVDNVGENGRNVVKLNYDDGRVLMLLVFAEIAQAFKLDLYGESGATSVLVEDWDYFYWKMLDTYAAMLRDKALPVPLQETLEIIRVLTAAKESLLTGKAIKLPQGG